jgi:hypothetical protein
MPESRKLRHYYRKKYSYNYCIDCSAKPDGTPNRTYIPINQFAIANNLSIAQCKTLLKKRILVGISMKGKLSVALIGSLDDYC